MTIGERLKHLRLNKGLRQNEAAKALGLSNVVLNRYENDERLPDIETLARLALFYEVTTDYLIGKEKLYNNRADTSPFLTVREDSHKYGESSEEINAAISNDPELAEFWEELTRREDLQLMFKQTRDLSPQSIKKVIKIIKAIEDEESEE